MQTLRTLVGAAALLLALPLAACSAVPNGTATIESRPDAGGGAASDSIAEAPGDVARAEDRSIVRSGSIELEIADVTESVAEVSGVVDRLGGDVASQQVSNSGDSVRTASIYIRVPTDRFDDAFNALGELGTVRSEQRASEDVTEYHVDLAARVAALETSVERLTDLLARAATTSELIEVETALAERQAELDGLKAQLASLEGQIDLAAISVWLTEPTVRPGGGPQNFWESLQAGFASIGSFAAGFVVVAGVLLPWALIAGVIAAAVLIPLAIRRRNRRRRSPAESVDIAHHH